MRGAAGFVAAAVVAAMVLGTSLSLAGSARGQAPAPEWSIVTPGPTVPQGNVLHIAVVGPPNATFLLQMNAPPFNDSPPVVSAVGTTPNATSCLGGIEKNCTASAANVTVPTSPLAAQQYQISLYSRSVLENQSYVTIVESINASWVNSTIEGLVVELHIDEAALYNARENLASDHQTISFQGVAILALGAISIVSAVVAVGMWYRTRPPRDPETAAMGAFMSLWDAFHITHTALAHRGTSQTKLEGPRIAEPLDPEELPPVDLKEAIGE